MAIGVYQFVIASLRSVHFSLTNRLGVKIIYVVELYICLGQLKGKKSLLYDGFAFPIDRVLKNSKGRIKTDEHSSAIINGNCNHKHETDSRKIQEKIIRAVVKRKAASDITTRPIKLVRWEFVV
jgi:hypothetical protein